MVGLNFFSIAPVYGNESETKDNKDYWFENFLLKSKFKPLHETYGLLGRCDNFCSLNPSNGCMAIYSAQI